MFNVQISITHLCLGSPQGRFCRNFARLISLRKLKRWWDQVLKNFEVRPLWYNTR